jgi:predicted transcriptional regulator
MPLLKPPPKAPRNETLQLRIEAETKTKLHKYAQFLDSSDSYVVGEALKLLFRKDADFRVWLEANNDHENPETDSEQRLLVASKE